MNSQIDSIISASFGLAKEFKDEQFLKKSLQKLITKPMPNKGNVVGLEEVEDLVPRSHPSNLEEKRNIEQNFTKVRPKSALHDKFARPSTGTHSIYKKKQVVDLSEKCSTVDHAYQTSKLAEKPPEFILSTARGEYARQYDTHSAQAEGSRRFGQR